MLKIIKTKSLDAFESGRELGEAIRSNIRERLARYTITALFRRQQEKINKAGSIANFTFPNHIQELKGMAEGANVDYEKLLFLNLPEINDDMEGCTGIAYKHDSDTFLAHNEDSVDSERRADCFLVKFKRATYSFTAFCYAGELPGPMYGWNSHGIYYSTNWIEPMTIDDTGVSRSFTARAILDMTSIESAIEMLKQTKCASGYHHFVGQGNVIFSVEQQAGNVSVVEIPNNEWFVHTNHYRHKRFTRDGNVPTPSHHSLLRHYLANKLMEQVSNTPLSILASRKNSPKSICTRRGEELHTVSTVLFKPMQNKVEVYTPETLVLEHSFELQGEGKMTNG